MERPGRLAALGVVGLAAVFACWVRSEEPTPIYNTVKEEPPLSAAEAAARFQAPPGFRVTVFAAEPDVRQPIALAWDRRGRLWVAENHTYAERARRFDLRLHDRVVIFDGANGHSSFTTRQVFSDEWQMLTGLEVGHGGVWLLCPPQLLFVPSDGDRPTGTPQAVLDGFTVPAVNYHNLANGLRWGPDGWLYGRCGASAPGRVGRPGTPAEQRVPLHGGVWRYHPIRRTFEALCHGTTNPWGHDWNALGELFFINTVNGHLWHVIAGAHYQRPHTIDPNPHTYELIDQHADHYHWDTSKSWMDSRQPVGEHDRRGGGHAHSGLMIYLADQWPKDYHGKLLTLNFHGRRVNVERLERVGGGYVGRHEPDIFFAADPWFRGIDLSYGPDGGVFILDWADTGECHQATGVHRTSGRIYKVTHGRAAAVPLTDLARLSNRELVRLQRHANEWFVRQARQELADRFAAGRDLDDARADLLAMLARETEAVLRLRALWALSVIGAADDQLLVDRLRDPHEAVRAWAIRLLTDHLRLDGISGQRFGPDQPLADSILGELMRLAREDPSGLVRLVLASTLQRLPVGQRPMLAAPLLARAEDAGDHDIPLMLWYGLIPLADADPSALAGLVGGCAVPTTRRLMVRRLAEEIDKRPGSLNDLLRLPRARTEAAFAADLLAGLAAGLRGWRKAPKPEAWEAFAAAWAEAGDATMRQRLRELNVVFGDGRALEEVQRLALDERADLETRRAALQTLIDSQAPNLRSVCEQLLKVRFLNTTAVRGLTRFDDPAIGEQLARNYTAFHPSERSAVMDALVSRPAFARALLAQVAAGRIPRSDLTAGHARQILSFRDAKLAEQLEAVWGKLRESPAEKKEAMARLKAALAPEVLARADLSRGRAVFQQACGNCHKLYGHGGDIGPDLTGAHRDNLDYLLENIVDPAANVSADFRLTQAVLVDGRVLNGIIKAQTPQTVTLQLEKEVVVLRRDDIEALIPSEQSLMPEQLLQPFTPEQVRDLFAYLMHRTQVPLPAGK
ncbi:MAG: c-type cytochrome [Gemmataceae bacterium]|nr:c-type cytochrome [Gemmataceae bacterium]MDW8266002.1 c-type cytochrome [Gemmataceae bacterium]